MTRSPTPIACERCGSVYFHQAEFRQYREGLYSSAAGGGLSPVSDLPQLIRICICGEPLPDLGIRRLGDDARSFTKCVAAAKAHRARQQPEALLEEMLKALATTKELAETQQRLANLEKALLVITVEAKAKDTN